MGNGKCFTYFIGVDLWLIFIFQGWEMGNVLESAFSYYCRERNFIFVGIFVYGRK